MNRISGITFVDTLYELMGYRLGQGILDFLYSIYLPVAVALGALAYVYWRCMERGSFRDLGFFLVYLIFMAWLITPVPTEVAFPAGTTVDSIEEFKRLVRQEGQGAPEVRIPRALLLIHSLTDGAVKVLASRANRTFLSNPFGTERLAARLRQSGINDSRLRERFLRFVAG